MNPFNPGFGKVPPIYLERSGDIKKVMDNLNNMNSPYQTTLVYGMRGTGKTAFITDISHEVQKRPNWVVANLAMGNPLLPTLIDSIYHQGTSAIKNIFRSVEGITVSAFGITVKAVTNQNISRQYQNLLEMILKKMKDSGTWLLITIDEVKSTPELRQFAAVYQLILREEYPISLIMTGLPQYVSELQNDDVLTFLLRAGRITLTPLNLWAVKSSYAKAFSGQKHISEETLLHITRLTKGYAYAFQLLGYYLWENSSGEINEQVVKKILPEYQTDLYRNAYFKMYQGLSETEQRFLQIMAENSAEDIPVREIEKKMGKPGNYISVYRRRLLDTQLITAPRRGYLQFTLPFFREFIIEALYLY